MYVLNVIIRAKLFKKIETVSINEMYPIAYKMSGNIVQIKQFSYARYDRSHFSLVESQ